MEHFRFAPLNVQWRNYGERSGTHLLTGLR